MKNITTSSYVFSSKLDKFYLENLSATPIVYRLYIVVDTVETLVINNTQVSVATVSEVKVPKDGQYRLEVESTNIYFETWIQLRKYILPIVEETLRPCCECHSTKDIDYLTPDTKAAINDQYLYNLLETYKCGLVDYNTDSWDTINEKLTNFLFKAANTNRASTMPMMYDQMMKAAINGTAVNNPTLYEWYVSFIYLGMYSYDREDINTSIPEEEKALQVMYNYDIITSYIKKLGVDVTLTLSLYQ